MTCILKNGERKTLNTTDELLILLIEVVIKTHDYEDLNPYKDRLAKIKVSIGY